MIAADVIANGAGRKGFTKKAGIAEYIVQVHSQLKRQADESM